MNSCNGACDQGRQSCPTPEACQLGERADTPYTAVGALLAALAVVCAVAAVLVVLK